MFQGPITAIIKKKQGLWKHQQLWLVSSTFSLCVEHAEPWCEILQFRPIVTLLPTVSFSLFEDLQWPAAVISLSVKLILLFSNCRDPFIRNQIYAKTQICQNETSFGHNRRWGWLILFQFNLEYMQDFTLCELVYGGRLSPAQRALEEFTAKLICHGQNVFQVNFVL